VAQVVQADRSQAGLSDESREHLGGVLRRERLAGFPGEDEPVVGVGLAPRCTFRLLDEAMGKQGPDPALTQSIRRAKPASVPARWVCRHSAATSEKDSVVGPHRLDMDVC